MKKILVLTVILFVGLIAATTGSAYAASANDTVGVLITVDPKFTFAIGEDVVDMGTVAEGSTGSGSVTMYCGTNQGNWWWILIESTAIVGSSTGAEIPLSNLCYNTYPLPDSGGVSSNGSFYSASLDGGFAIAYTSGPSEECDTDVRIGMALRINVPYNTPADTYSTTVTCTMSE